jgi:hypothetical protein
MRADEYVVEELLAAKAKIAELEEEIDNLQDDLDVAAEEIAEYKRLIVTLSKYADDGTYTFSISLRNYSSSDKDDLEFVKSFIHVENADAEVAEAEEQ